MRYSQKLFAGVGLLIATILLVMGCEGPQGPAGRDAYLQDTKSPTVNWIYPHGGDTIRGTDTLRVRVIDNGVADSVVFYVNGYDTFPGLTNITHIDNVYRAVWNTGTRTGLYSLTVRAYDDSLNMGQSPSILVFLNPTTPRLTGIQYLQNFTGTDTTVGWRIPDVDSTFEWGVRLTPTQSCSLQRVRYVIDRVSFMNENPPDFYCFLSQMTSIVDTNVQLSRIDSVLIPGNTLLMNGRLDSITFQNRVLSANTNYMISLRFADNLVSADTMRIETDRSNYTGKDYYRVPAGWRKIGLPTIGDPDPHNLMIGAVVKYY